MSDAQKAMQKEIILNVVILLIRNTGDIRPGGGADGRA